MSPFAVCFVSCFSTLVPLIFPVYTTRSSFWTLLYTCINKRAHTNTHERRLAFSLTHSLCTIKRTLKINSRRASGARKTYANNIYIYYYSLLVYLHTSRTRREISVHTYIRIHTIHKRHETWMHNKIVYLYTMIIEERKREREVYYI